jgi:hypothetical protein
VRAERQVVDNTFLYVVQLLLVELGVIWLYF